MKWKNLSVGQCNKPGQPQAPIFPGDYSFNTGKIKGLSVEDYVIIAAFLIVLIIVATFVTWRNRSHTMGIEEFLLASRKANGCVAGMSMCSTYTSAMSLLGVPVEMYRYSSMYLWMIVTYFLVSALASPVLMPVFFKFKFISIHEYLGRRFGRGIRCATAAIFLIQTTMFLAVALFAPSLVLHVVTGFNMWLAVFTMGIVCTMYTLGGMRAVLYTDAFQILLVILGLTVFLFNAHSAIGSIQTMVTEGQHSERLFSFYSNRDQKMRHSVSSVVIGGFISFMGLIGTNQTTVQRGLSCRTLGQAKLAFWVSFTAVVSIECLCCLIGVYMSAFYQNCDPKKAGIIEKDTHMIILFMMDVMGHSQGLCGVFLVALFSGALSTIASGLHSISTVVLEDFLRLYTEEYIPDHRARLYAQFACVIFGVICLLFELIFSLSDDIFQTCYFIAGGLAAPTLGVFCLGLFVPYANKKGATWGMVVSSVFVFILTAVRLSADIEDDDGSEVGIKEKMEDYAGTSQTCLSNCNVSVFNNESLHAIYRIKHPKLQPGDIRLKILYFPSSGDNNSVPVGISYMWLPIFPVVICLVVGVLTSFFTGFNDPKDVDPRLIVPLADVIFPLYYLPESLRSKLRFGIDHRNKWETDKTEETRSGEESGGEDAGLSEAHDENANVAETTESQVSIKQEDLEKEINSHNALRSEQSIIHGWLGVKSSILEHHQHG